jgi:hypothetical protein
MVVLSQEKKEAIPWAATRHNLYQLFYDASFRSAYSHSQNALFPEIRRAKTAPS